jgi:PAS domain S-box-containing protein
MKRLAIDLHSLSVQMILSFVLAVLLTAITAGLPAIWLIRDQLDREAWAQVDQSSRATRALYAARRSEVADLATLTAQRPSLRESVAQGDQSALTAYIRTLQTGARLGLIVVCDVARRPVAQAGAAVAGQACGSSQTTGFHVFPGETAPQVWLLAARPVGGETTSPETVIVGLALDGEFAAQMHTQTGLEHTLLVDGQPVATSFGGGLNPWLAARRRPAQSAASDGAVRSVFDLDGRPYYGARFPLGEPGVEVEIALGVEDMVAAQQRLGWTLAGGILVIAVLGSLLGAFLAQRIGQPLARLAGAAAALSRPNGGPDAAEQRLAEALVGPVPVDTRVREIALVAQALEEARVDLQRTLADLRQEKAWTGHLLEAIVEGIVTLDRQGQITYFSQGAERITGWSRVQVLGRYCDEVFRPAETDEPFSQFIPAPGRRHKITLKVADGRQVTVAVTGARLVPPEVGEARVALVFRDVSEEETVHRLLGHFLVNVAHEFRTPLTALAASIELLMDQAPDLSTAELQELLTSLHLGIVSLQTLVDNLLESSSIEAGRFRVSPRPADLGDIIGEATRMMRPLLDKHGQRLIIELPAAIPVVQADPRRMIQVLVNLLSNASKYGPDDAEITLSVAANQGWVRVAVADQGPGVLPEHRDDLFRRFAHPGAGDDKAQYGAGLGLSVVKAVVEAHNGQVGVENRAAGGLVLWFTLPAVD